MNEMRTFSKAPPPPPSGWRRGWRYGNNPYRVCCPKGYGFCVISVQKQLAGIDFAQIGQESGMEV